MSLFFRKVKPKPKAQEKKKTVADDPWSCTRCTYINKPMHLSCDMCGSQREFEKKEPEKPKEKDAEFEYVPDITARMETLLETSKFSDVKFIVGEEEKEILAHKVVICRRSPVFAAMFASGFKETTSSEPIRIVDVEAEIFETMIKCMYTDDMDAEDDNVLQLLFCCDKYGFEYGRNECIRQLRQNLTVENAATAYDKLPGLLEDEKYILDFVDENGDEIISQDSFLSLSPKTIHDIVQRDKLQVNEGELFNVVRKWAERQCRREGKEPTTENQKAILRDIIPHIRFPLMTLEEVSDISRLDLLTKEQALSLFLYLGAEEDKRSELKVPFVTKERTQNIRKDLIWNKFHRLYMQSADKKSVTYIGGGTRQHVTAMTKTSMRPGRYRVRLENRGGWTWSVGICTDKHSLETALGRDSESWGFTYMGQLLHNNAERSGYGPSLSQCVVEIVLDAKRRLSFRSYSSQIAPPGAAFTDHGAAYTIPGNAHLYVAVSMDYDSTATLLGYDKDPNGRDWPS